MVSNMVVLCARTKSTPLCVEGIQPLNAIRVNRLENFMDILQKKQLSVDYSFLGRDQS